ncbi:MAG TPA: hypothetical protein P5519_08115 [Spirochaetia bacterium]|nr:hypothetical protein [Spirochaetales bacterium]HPD81171.1 hypothetical protein [Spirochaetales bacterium]HQK35289.1 hypothetical protein [Spirochaetales bacterium]HRS65842.1 hypothetical protein [Spirochaetia bacterium]
MNIVFSNDDAVREVIIGWVEIKNAAVCESSAPFKKQIEELIAERLHDGFPPESLKQGVRAMLRRGGFKPAGRQKPASEYLLQSVREGVFPIISAPVDCNNYYSLKTGLPISILDTRITGSSVLIKIASQNESYVFNTSGQSMDLSGLLCVSTHDGKPIGNPVKDSMEAKLKQDSTGFAGFIYAPRTLFTKASVQNMAEEFANLLCRECGGTLVSCGAVLCEE